MNTGFDTGKRVDHRRRRLELEEENVRQNKFGTDFGPDVAWPLTNDEAAKIIFATRGLASADQRKTQKMEERLVFFHDRVKIYPTQQNLAVVRAYFEDLGAAFTNFEKVTLANLLPETVEEAISYLPSLAGTEDRPVDDKKLDLLLRCLYSQSVNNPDATELTAMLAVAEGAPPPSEEEPSGPAELAEAVQAAEQAVEEARLAQQAAHEEHADARAMLEQYLESETPAATNEGDADDDDDDVESGSDSD